MARGDAFNRTEVSSVYVGPKDRYVVSLIVGVPNSEVSDAESAALSVLSLVTGPERANVVWTVFDRETGEQVDLQQASFDPAAFSALGHEPDPFPSDVPPKK